MYLRIGKKERRLLFVMTILWFTFPDWSMANWTLCQTRTWFNTVWTFDVNKLIYHICCSTRGLDSRHVTRDLAKYNNNLHATNVRTHYRKICKVISHGIRNEINSRIRIGDPPIFILFSQSDIGHASLPRLRSAVWPIRSRRLSFNQVHKYSWELPITYRLMRWWFY